jgi:hypothetical protein
MTNDQLEFILTNQAPKDPAIVAAFEALRVPAKEFACVLNDLCPESREKSLAITDLQRCVQMAVASIALNQDAVLDV